MTTPAQAAAPVAPTYSDANSLGGVTIYGPGSMVITSGASNMPVQSVIDHVIAQGLTPVFQSDPSSTTFASLAIYVPTGAPPDQWSGGPLSLNTTQTNLAANEHVDMPAITKTRTLDTVLQGIDRNYATSSSPIDYEVRLLSTDSDGDSPTSYYTVDLSVDPTAHTFTIVRNGMGAGVATSTVLDENPSSPATADANGNAAVTLTAGVSASDNTTPSGTVQFFNNNQPIGSAPVDSDGFATSNQTFTVSNSPYSLTATYTPAGTTDQGSSTTSSAGYTVRAGATPPAGATATTTSIASDTQSPTTVGTNVTLTSTTTAGAPGNIQFTDGTRQVGAAVAVDANGKASVSETPTAGSHSYVATFTPTDNTQFGMSNSAAFPLTVNLKPTSVSLAAAPASTTAGSMVTLTANPTGGAAGTISFADNGNAISAASGSTDGTTAVTYAYTPAAGDHSYVATYTPTDTATYVTSMSAAQAVSVTLKPTSVGLTATPNSVTAGQSVTLTATPTGSTPGTITFADNGIVITADTTTTDGTTPVTVNDQPLPGTHSYIATYTPTDANYVTSMSAAQPVTSTAIATTVSLTADQSGRINAGTSVTLSAQASAGVPGTVVFNDNGAAATSSMAVDANGKANTTVTPGAGQHSYTAVFKPTDPDYATSTSNAAAVMVGSVPTTVTLGASPATTVTLGTQVTLTGTATRGVPGSIAFLRNGVGITSVPVDGNGAASTLVRPTIGSQSYVAIFTPSDSDTYASSTTPALVETATPSAPVIAAKVITSRPAYGHKANVQVTVSAPGAVPSGIVQVTLSGRPIAFGILANGSTIFTLPATLKPGVHSLEVNYLGDANVAAGTRALKVTVNKGKTTLALRISHGKVGAGKHETVTALLRGDGFTAQGKIQIIIKHRVVATGTYRHGYVNIKLPILKAGSYQVYAKYVGSSTAQAVNSRSHGFTVA